MFTHKVLYFEGENLEPISDERAHRVLHRVDLLLTIRNKVSVSMLVDQHIKD